VEAQILHTPGHTPGSICIALEGVVITGDTLFPGGPGATRFDHSSFDTIIESISTKLFTLPDNTVVLPGHGDATTIGTERPQLLTWIDRGW
jgi:glyoxylase-like metal-dependent hydrolase (beta-lactamase superfamily II)